MRERIALELFLARFRPRRECGEPQPVRHACKVLQEGRCRYAPHRRGEGGKICGYAAGAQGLKRNRTAHRMGHDHTLGRRATGDDGETAHQRIDIGLERRYVPADRVLQRTIRQPLTRPVQAQKREVARLQVAHHLEVFLDRFRPPRAHHGQPARACLRHKQHPQPDAVLAGVPDDLGARRRRVSGHKDHVHLPVPGRLSAVAHPISAWRTGIAVSWQHPCSPRPSACPA